MSRLMKNSGVPWIGEIPNEWGVLPFRRVFEITKRLAGRAGLDVLSVTQQGIKIKDLTSNEGQMAQDYSNYQLVYPSDFVMNHMDLLTGYIDISQYAGVTSPDYRVFRALSINDINQQYFLYIFQLCYKCRIFYNLGQGVSGFGRWRLPAKQMLLFELPIPSLSEQNVIAEFLNKKCGEINRMITLQDKIVEELKVFKQSLLSEAITRGLNPNVPMKDSGVDWIGSMPKHWALSKMKHIGTYINGYAFKPSDWKSSGKPIIRIQDLSGTTVEPNFYQGTLDKKYLITSGDILISWAATLDAFIWRGNDGWLNQHIFKAEPQPNVNRHYFYWITKVAMINMRNANRHGIVMEHVTTGVFNNYIIPLAPEGEQQAIADYLDNKCKEIDTLISVRQAKIEALKEYKKSIIYEYVTGKKEVNG